MQSRLVGHHPSSIVVRAKRPQQAGIAKMLNTAEPTTVPSPISPSVMNVPTQLMNSSGDDVAMDMKVAPATSSRRWSSEENSF